MRVEAIEDLSALTAAERRLLESVLTDETLPAYRRELDRDALVVYRLVDPGGRRSTLVAPASPDARPGTFVVCTRWTTSAQQASFDASADEVEISVAAGLEPCAEDL